MIRNDSNEILIYFNIKYNSASRVRRELFNERCPWFPGDPGSFFDDERNRNLHLELDVNSPLKKTFQPIIEIDYDLNLRYFFKCKFGKYAFSEF